MEHTLRIATTKPSLPSRLMAHPLIRIVLGIVLTFGAVPLTMIAASKLVAKPYRVMWPQLLAAALVWFGYRFYVRRIEKRQALELSTPGMARELGAGLLLGAVLVTGTFAILAVLGAYRLDGINPVSAMMLVPLAEMALVGMTEEMMFRGVIFGVAERSLGSLPAIAISSLVFGLGHLPNEGASVLGVSVITAYGVLQAALYMKTRRLWICIGTHMAWNYGLDVVFSSTVSGHAASSGLLRGTLAGDTLLTGGAFGVEGSLVTLLLIGASAAYWLRRAFAQQRTSR
ncbi:CPBP family intramembrane metalloprotease [Duganella sp. LX20W]|uniref:CPBP family intramembrane metalloprotease n=1 Tax=Rugamonas brunnea TaxID=2758569 RepID=A0A7W2IA10_9BURK|nr:type II CAAX endopeptidase family protein [Rugamonas brunnea]MBA5635670.1 CPBP family intramembrane metalloprotease [Rugamonas brunnea]